LKFISSLVILKLHPSPICHLWQSSPLLN
jgi:hypothetical protein